MKPLNDSERATLYANLASGAESGWDYSSRWIATPRDAADDVYFPLRSLNTREIVGVDVNSILYANEMTIAGYLNASGDGARAAEFEARARNRSAAMYDLMWSEEYHGYFDYNLTSGSQNLWVPLPSDYDEADNNTDPTAITEGAPRGYQLAFHAAQFYPFWLGAAPAHLRDNPLAVRNAYVRVATLLDHRVGAVAATNYATGQQWDRPNVWSPLVYAVAQGLLATPATFGADDPAHKALHALALRLAQRYLDSTFCTWRATGGSTSELPRIEDGDANKDAHGIMFEKYADDATNVAGGGGEYEVVEGFGWTNGVLIWAVDTFGNDLVRPDCGNLTETAGSKRKRSVAESRVREPSAVELSSADAKFVKKFGRRKGNRS